MLSAFFAFCTAKSEMPRAKFESPVPARWPLHRYRRSRRTSDAQVWGFFGIGVLGFELESYEGSWGYSILGMVSVTPTHHM